MKTLIKFKLTSVKNKFQLKFIFFECYGQESFRATLDYEQIIDD